MNKLLCIVLAWSIAAVELMLQIPRVSMFLVNEYMGPDPKWWKSSIVEFLLVTAVVLTLLRYASRQQVGHPGALPNGERLIELVARRTASAACVVLGSLNLLQNISSRIQFDLLGLSRRGSLLYDVLGALVYFVVAMLFWRSPHSWWSIIRNVYKGVFTVTPEDELRD